MSKKLVAYFSVSGITKEKAQALAAAAEATLYEIKPAVPYTDADVKWRNPMARCNREWIKKAEVALSDTDADVASADVIFLLFPIWYFNAPLIIRSFLKAYDFTGKKIVLAATSGGSELGKTAPTLQEIVPTAQVIEGIMLNGAVSDETLQAFAQQY